MVKTVQELIEQAKEKEELIKIVKEGIRKERIAEFKSYFKKPMPVSEKVKRLDVKTGAVVRKAVHLVAPKGLVKTLTRPSGKGKGRGRPAGTFKTRYVPGVGAVKVPTHIYKRMLAQAKAKRRLAEAQRQAQYQQRVEAEQIAIAQDPRFQPQDVFLESPDIEHEQEVMQMKQQMLIEEQMQQQQVPQRGVVQRAGDVVRQFGAGINRLGQPRPSQQYSQEIIQQYPQQQMVRQVRSEPRVSVLSDKSSILNAPNMFNRPEDVAVGFKRRV